jgi:sensor c-di-GMP phosphodiesterase-like protein
MRWRRQDARARSLDISVDDFGTGYASIANLQSMPIDILKVGWCRRARPQS